MQVKKEKRVFKILKKIQCFDFYKNFFKFLQIFHKFNNFNHIFSSFTKYLKNILLFKDNFPLILDGRL